MGETDQDRIEFLHQLAIFDPQPESVTIIPVKFFIHCTLRFDLQPESVTIIPARFENSGSYRIKNTGKTQTGSVYNGLLKSLKEE